jgi:hypothetical protein
LYHLRTVYEDEASLPAVPITTLVDLRLLPWGMRRIEAVLTLTRWAMDETKGL